MFQAGAPSHLELFDNKPELTKRNGQLPPAELLKGYRAAFINPNSALLGPKYQVRAARQVRHGAERSAAAHRQHRRRHLPDPLDADRRGQSCPGADHDEHRLAAVRPAQLRFVDAVWPGQRVGEICPALSCSPAPREPAAAPATTAAAFLPTMYGGIPFRSAGDPVLYLSNPAGIDDETQRASLDTLTSTE